MGRKIDCKVRVIAHLEARPDVIRWEMDAANKHDGELLFSNEYKGDEYVVAFHLDDKTGLNLVFPDKVADAMWVSPSVTMGNPICPTSANFNPAFTAVPPNPNGKGSSANKLVVLNTNALPGRFAFSLRVIPKGKDQSDPANFMPPYDPIVDNRNGGGNPKNNISALVIGAVAVAAVAFVVYQAFFK